MGINARATWPLSSASTRSSRSSSHSRVELIATEHTYRICVLAPGIRMQDIEVTVEGDLMVVKGSTGGRGVHQQIRLPRDAYSDKTTATHLDGVLTLDVPKRAATPARNIDITVGALAAASTSTSAESDSTSAETEAPSTSASAAPSTSASAEAVEPALALAEKGFTDAELVALALEKTGGDVDAAGAALSALEDLSAVTALDDLEEMGFSDRHENRKALLANDGSVKRAVKALVANA